MAAGDAYNVPPDAGRGAGVLCLAPRIASGVIRVRPLRGLLGGNRLSIVL